MQKVEQTVQNAEQGNIYCFLPAIPYVERVLVENYISNEIPSIWDL